MITAPISFEFLKRLYSMPTWAEIAYGFEHQLLSSKVVIDYTLHKIATTDAPNDDELAIASSSTSDSIIESVRKLAIDNGVNDEDKIRSSWAKILLAWIYEHREQYDDLLDIVEEVYSDYDYPEELAGFVRYMPSDTPSLENTKTNEQRIMTSIGKYVEQFLFHKNI